MSLLGDAGISPIIQRCLVSASCDQHQSGTGTLKRPVLRPAIAAVDLSGKSASEADSRFKTNNRSAIRTADESTFADRRSLTHAATRVKKLTPQIADVVAIADLNLSAGAP